MSATFTTINDACVALQTGKTSKVDFLAYAKGRQHDTKPMLKLMVDKVLTMDDLNEIISAQHALAAASAPKSSVGLHFKVSEKGAVSVYGLQARFPVTLYGDQWARLLDRADDLRKFMTDNAGKLSTKPPKAS